MQNPGSQSVAEWWTAMFRDASTLNRHAFKCSAHPASFCSSSCRRITVAIIERLSSTAVCTWRSKLCLPTLGSLHVSDRFSCQQFIHDWRHWVYNDASHRLRHQPHHRFSLYLRLLFRFRISCNCFFFVNGNKCTLVCFLLGNSPASEFYMPTFRNTLSVPSS
jgi:hypothetical protein